MADLNRYSPAFFEPDLIPERTAFGEAVDATVGLRFAPIAEGIVQGFKYGATRDPNYDPMKDLGDYSLYASDLARAKNAMHMAELKRGIDRGIERRQTLADATFMTQLGAGLFDPVNLIALPLGGPGIGVGRSALRVGLGTMATEAAAEAAVAPFDPVKTAEEFALNTLSAGLFGAAMGGAISIPVTRSAAAFEATMAANREMFAAATRIENLSGMTPEQIASAPARTERPFGVMKDEEVNQNVLRLETEAARIEKDMPNRAADLRAEAQTYRNELGIRAVEDLGVDLKDPYNLKQSWFTDSVFYKMVSTPMKRTLQGNYPSAVKETFVKTFGDSGITLALNSVGIASPQSVYQRAAVSSGRWVQAHDGLIRIWADETGASTASRLDINVTDLSRRASRSEGTYREWLTTLSEKRIKGITDLSENELKAMSVINKYFEEAEVRLEETGLIATTKGLKRKIEMLDNEITQLRASLKGVRKSSNEYSMVEDRIKRLESQRDGLIEVRSEPDAPFDKEAFFPRFFDKAAIRKKRQQFADILYKHFEENPYVYREEDGQPVKVELLQNPSAIMGRVNQTIDNILGEADPTSLDTVSFGMGRSKHFRHRQLDIPNSLVSDFMVKDPLAVMKAYSARIEPRYEFAKQFGKDLDGVLFDIERSMIKAGKSQAEINKVMRDYRHMYGRVAGSILENPDALSQKAAFFLREAASFSYMGAAGLAALPDFGRIVMEYDMENIARGVQGILEKESLNMTVDEVRIAGEAIDILKGSAHMRLVEDMSNNIDANELLNSARNAFYILNGLAPLTTIAKQLAGVIDAHTIIEKSIKLTKGQLDEQGIEWLARYGIGKEDAALIARAPWAQSKNGLYMANTESWVDSIYVPEIDGQTVKIIEANEDGSAVGKQVGDRYVPAFFNEAENTIRFDRDFIEGKMFEEKAWLNPKVDGVDALPDIFKTPKQWSNFVMLHEIMHTRSKQIAGETKAAYENRINQLALEEYKAQKTINQDAVQKFRVALNSGVLNTIMAGTPADKPIITDGVAYIPMSVAKQFGMKEHPKYKGYARVENGLMGLPFQFYSYVLANVNKTVGAMAQGQVKNRAIGVATMMGLAYMSLKLRTPDRIWQDMSWQDRFARSFDMSGVMALYSDLFYTSMHTSLALGGPSITAGFLSPKFKQQESVADALTGLAGAGPSWAYDTATGIANFATGNYGEGAKQVVRNLPGARLWFLRDDINQITNAWAN
jgi:hypothetical protein